MAKMPKPEEMIASRASFPEKSWMDVKTEIKAGMYAYPAKVDIMEGLHMPHPHAWQPEEEDWHLPENWEEIIYKALKERLAKHRSLKIFMDTCVRCGACADKCHFFLGTNDPKNMPVLRAELLRSVSRRDFTTAGRLLGKVAGARKLTTDVIKEWFTYFYQCTECRRCSLFCPYGIDTAEITAIVRELLHELGLGINWIMEPVSNCNRTGNHLGIQPHAFKEIVEFLCEDIETITGIHIDPPFNEKGHEILFITPSGDVFAEPGIYTFMGYLMLFHELGLDYTLSTYASEGGNFGSFVSFDMAKKLNAKMYAEAKRLGSKWILGGECGHMWRVINQYMATYNGPAPEGMMDVPTSPITGTRFENARATKMVHIAEFTADLIHHNKLNLRPERNTGIITTWPAPWVCSKSPAPSCAPSAPNSWKCPRTPSGKKPSAAVPVPASTPRKSWNCACAPASPAGTPSATCRKRTASTGCPSSAPSTAPRCRLSPTTGRRASPSAACTNWSPTRWS